ncbi:MAG: cupin domain-containing protein [Rhodobacteraceae bacterium]|nr:cupin domain-containing protein [Paracoccaceae bacterium]
MNETTHLGGKVVKRSLPVFDAPTGPDAPLLKRLLLPQGELAQFFDSDEAIHYMAMIELRAGGVRGNHFHHRKEEWAYIIEGEALLVVENATTKHRDTITLGAGEVVRIAPGVAHAYRTVQAGRALEFSPARFDPADTIRYPLE